MIVKKVTIKTVTGEEITCSRRGVDWNFKYNIFSRYVTLTDDRTQAILKIRKSNITTIKLEK